MLERAMYPGIAGGPFQAQIRGPWFGQQEAKSVFVDVWVGAS